MSDLPPGWTEAPLESVTEILDSLRIPVNQTERAQRTSGKEPDSLFPYFGATGVVGEIDGFLFDEPLILLGEDGVPFLDPMRHKAYLVQGKCWVNNHAHVLRAITGYSDRRFLAAFLNQFDYTGYVSGSTRLKLNQGEMRKVPVRVAPINEQKRIADKLDTLLSRVDACRERLDRVPAILKRFRQSILAAACSGQLTADWREENATVETAATLSNRIQSERFDLWCQVAQAKAKSDGRTLAGDSWHARYEPAIEIDTGELSAIPATWKWTSFDTFVASFQYGPRFGESEYTTATEGVPTVRTSDMNFRGEITLCNPPRVVLPDNSRDHFLLQPDDLVVTRTGATIVKCALYSSSLGPVIASAYLIRYRLTRTTSLPKYLLAVLMSPWGQEQLLGGARAVAQPNVNTQTIAKIPIPLPPLAEQQEIVRRVDQLFAFADALEARVATAQAQVNRLTPSLLAKAFRGELVPQDPNDEPAIELLKRIQAARTAEPANPKRGKGTKKKKKAEANMLSRKDVKTNHLTAILTSQGPLTAEALWAASLLDIDDFYDQLKAEEETGLLKERRSKSANDSRLLEAA